MADVLAALAHENVGSATVPTWQAGSPRRRDLRPALRPAKQSVFSR